MAYISIALASSILLLWCRNLTFYNISVITEDIYLKLEVCVHFPKSNSYYQGRQFKIHFSELCPFFSLNILSSIKHPTGERWHPHVVLLVSLSTSCSWAWHPHVVLVLSFIFAYTWAMFWQRREKEKMLVTPYSHNVFQRLLLQGRKKQGLFGKGLIHFSQNDETMLTH